METWRTSKGHKVYQVLAGRANAYLVTGSDQNILIDTGTSRHYNELRKNISALLSDHQKIDKLFLTHVHFDHCQNAARIKKEDGAAVITGREETEAAIAGYTDPPGGTSFFPKMISRLGRSVLRKRLRFEPFSPDIRIGSDGMMHRPDEGVTAINTPGHTRGSVSLIVDNEIALVGDTLFGIFPDSVFPPFSNDIPEMIKSWKKLLDTGCHIYLPGHGAAITRDRLSKQYAQFSAP